VRQQGTTKLKEKAENNQQKINPDKTKGQLSAPL